MNKSHLEKKSSKPWNLVCICLLVSPLLCLVSAQGLGRGEPAFPFQIVKKNIQENPLIQVEKIYVLLNEKYFDRQNLNNLFSYLSKGSSAETLIVTLFSDREMLNKEIRWDEMGIYDSVSDNPAREKIYDDFKPAEIGYFRAFYHRSPTTEEFSYSPRKDNFRVIIVTYKNNEKFSNSENFLFKSVTAGYLGAVKRYLDQNPKINLNIVDKANSTPLTWAVWLQHNEIAKLIIEAGADPNFLTVSGSALNAAIDAGNFEGVRILVESKANVNRPDANGKTPLMGAALYCNIEITKFLLESGANPELRDFSRKSAREYACNDKNLIRLLSSKLQNP